MTRRIVVLVLEDSETDDDLKTALTYAVVPPWKPVPPGENARTYEQERWRDQESTDRLVLQRIKQAAPKIHWVSSSILPDQDVP